jgi:hypothetical protein
MAFNDLLSTSFLFSVAIIVILIGAIFAYVSYRMSEQDHKISSMLGLISTMAEELQFFRNKLSKNSNSSLNTDEVNVEASNSHILDPNNLLNLVTLSNNTQLISVSDDEELEESDEEDDEETDDEETDDEETDDEETDDEEDLEDLEEQDLQEESDLGTELNLEEVVDLDVSEQLLENNELDDNLTVNANSNNIKSIHLEDPIELNYNINNEFKNIDPSDELLSSDLKSISISDLEETNKKLEYKKMSLNELKKVVLNKGIVPDASKLKKNELLKLLGDE